MAEGFPANGWASFQRVFEMGSTGKDCDLRRERNSHHWSGSSSPIGRTGGSEEKRELAEREVRLRKVLLKKHGFHTSTELGNKNKLSHSNIRLVFAFRSIEKGHSAAETFCGPMNLPSPPEKFRTNTELLFDSTKFTCEKSVRNSVVEATRIEGICDITIASDGSRQKRGYQSLNRYSYECR
ncbi:hypothetical protein TNCV_3535261 [Trichonephila clavipes]|nr:hypothetical protein TNCV_3535261 [Trichonephila clavipes]